MSSRRRCHEQGGGLASEKALAAAGRDRLQLTPAPLKEHFSILMEAKEIASIKHRFTVGKNSEIGR